MKDFNKKRCIKFCLNKKHEIPFAKMTLNHAMKHVTVEGQVVVRTCKMDLSSTSRRL